MKILNCNFLFPYLRKFIGCIFIFSFTCLNPCAGQVCLKVQNVWVCLRERVWGGLIDYLDLFTTVIIFCQCFKSLHFFLLHSSSYDCLSLQDNSPFSNLHFFLPPDLHYCLNCVSLISNFLQNNNAALSLENCIFLSHNLHTVSIDMLGERLPKLLTYGKKKSAVVIRLYQMTEFQIITLSKCLNDWNFYPLTLCTNVLCAKLVSLWIPD